MNENEKHLTDYSTYATIQPDKIRVHNEQNGVSGFVMKFVPAYEVSVDRLDPHYYRASLELASVLVDDERYILITELCTEITDGSRKARDFTEQGIPYLRISNLTPSGINLKGAKFLPSLNCIEQKAIISAGDILISKVASIWKVAVVDKTLEGAVISPDLIKIRPKDKEARDLLVRFLSTDIGRLSFAQVVTQSIIPKISLKQVAKIKVPLVLREADVATEEKQLADRQRLKSQFQRYYGADAASYLWTFPSELWVSEKLTSERLDVMYNQYLHSPLQQALSDRLKRECWVKFGQVATVVSNTVSPSEYNRQEIRYIGMKNINKETFKVDSAEQVLFEKVSSRARFRVEEQDILLGIVGSGIGEANHAIAIVPPFFEGALASSVFAVIRPLQCNSYYLLWCLNHPLVRFQFKMHSYGTTQQMLSIRSLMEVYVPLLHEKAASDVESVMKAYTGGL